jgi:hypothetical protein
MVWRRWLAAAAMARAPVRRRSSCCPCGSGFPPFHFRSRPFLRDPPRLRNSFVVAKARAKAVAGTPSLKVSTASSVTAPDAKKASLCALLSKRGITTIQRLLFDQGVAGWARTDAVASSAAFCMCLLCFVCVDKRRRRL